MTDIIHEVTDTVTDFGTVTIHGDTYELTFQLSHLTSVRLDDPAGVKVREVTGDTVRHTLIPWHRVTEVTSTIPRSI